MPLRPTTEEIQGFLQYLNDTAVDVNDFWRSVQPEVLQHVFRPIDIKETFDRGIEIPVVPGVVANVTSGFTPTPGRILVVRSLSVQQIGAIPDQVEVGFGSAVGTLDRPAHFSNSPSFPFMVGGRDIFTGNINSWLPQVVYTNRFLNVRLTIAPAADLAFTIFAEGEEYDIPFRNVAT